ncbi:hypothetical protein [Mucilaginibacter sp. SP1R1]|uniref:hypothetical protein n=1 Tax=Mucilaginibacter sp. SP1R1 TaxID=2723091 RepID=UPI0016114FCF|nr:hypothetical protein [Mucilaginibacter sp. SP1R1]MBB6149052.1 hypothetical protein [Mucilaginibacter sp. SP1R1]
MSEPIQRKIYLTDLERDLTFSGFVKSFVESGKTMDIVLLDVKVYEYSSSNFLYAAPEIAVSRPKSALHIEDVK